MELKILNFWLEITRSLQIFMKHLSVFVYIKNYNWISRFMSGNHHIMGIYAGGIQAHSGHCSVQLLFHTFTGV